MNENTVIETERLLLRQWKISDLDDLVEGLDNINVTKWMAFAPYPYTKKDGEEFIRNSIENQLYNFAIVLKSENKVIGGTQYRNINFIQGTASGGLWINEKYQDQGYESEVWGARIKYAFEVLGLRRLEDGFFEGNEKLWSLLQRYGYQLEGVRRQKYKALSTGNIVKR